MTSILDSNLLSTKDASALSGYNADYLSRLCRSGKIAGTQIGRTWLINRESLQQFVREQEERKQQIASELSQSREKEYQQAQKKIPAQAKRVSNTAQPVLSPFTSLVRRPAFALVLSIMIMGSSAYAATFGPVANVMQNAGALASAAQQTLTGSSSANEPRLRIASNVQARSAAPASAAQSTRPLAPSIDGAAIAKQLARVDVPDARAETDSFRILAYDDAATTAASLQASRAHTERAFGRFMASDEPFSARVIDGVVGFGFFERDIVATVLDSYSFSLNRAGEGSLAFAAGTRDAVTRSPELSAALLDTYASAMYGWVDGSQAVVNRTADTEMAAGPAALALVDGTQQQAHAFALAAQSAVDSSLDTTHGAASLALASAPHALPLPQQLITAEATTAPSAIVATAATFSPFDGGALVRQGGQIALATYSWIHAFAEGTRHAYDAVLAYFHGGSRLAVVPLPPAVTIPGDVSRAAQNGQAPAFETGISYTGTTQVTKITNYITGSSSTGITKAMLDAAIDAAISSLSGNSGSTIVQNTTSSSFTGGALNATTGDFSGDVHIGGNLTLGGTLTSSGAISAPFFTATSLSATSSFPNIISNSFSIGGDTITDFTGSGLAVVNGVLTATAVTSNAFQQGGNTFGATATLGTTDGNALTFITNNLTRMTIDAGGNVGIGTSTSASVLSVGGDVRADTFTAAGTGTSTLPRLITSALALGNDYVTGFTGNGLAIIGGVLGLDANNNYFSTTSSNFWLGTKSTSNLAEGSNKYFTDARADARINATSSIGTLLSAPNLGTVATSLTGILKATSGVLSSAVAGVDYENPLTFSGPLSRIGNTISIPQANGSTNGFLASADWTLFNNKIGSTSLSAAYPLTYSSATGVFATAFGTTTTNTFSALNTFNGGVAIGTLNGPLQANNGVVSATTSIGVLYGGTGLSVAPTFGQILVGNASSGYTLTATSSLGLESALTFSAPLSRTGNAISIPQANGSTNGFLASADWTLFNNKIGSTSLSAAYPLTYSSATGVFATAFGTTTSNTWAGTQTFTNSPVFSTLGAGNVSATAGGTLYSTGTSTPTLAAEFTYGGTLGQFIGGVSGSLSLTTNGTALTKLAQIAANTILGNNTGATGNVTAFATSTLFGTGIGGQTLTWSNGVPTWVATTTFSSGLTYANGNVTNTGVLAVGPLGQTTAGTALFASSTAGSDFTITGSGNTITFNLPSASASNRGLLTSADWSTFNGKQAALTFTYPLVNTTNTISLAFGTTTANSWSALQTFNGGASTTQISAVTGFFNSILATSTTATSTFSGGLSVGGTALNVLQNGKVGIGNSTPTATLDVTGTTRVSSTLTLASIPSCIGSQALQTNASGDISCGAISTGGASSGGGWTTNNAGVVSLSTTTDQTVVGASTTPYAKLTVLSGSTATTTLALFPASGQTANILDIYNTTGVLTSVIKSSGFFGLGTTSPTQQLSVQGNALFSGNIAAAGLTATGTVTFSGLGSGLVKSTSGVLSIASAGTDFLAPSSLSATYPLTYNSGTGVFAIAFGTTTSNTWAGTQTFTNSPVFSTLGAGNVSATAGGTLYSTGTSTPTLAAEFTYGGTLGQFIGGVSGSLSLTTNGVALTKIAQIAANTILGNNTGATGNVTAFATSTLGIALSDTTGTLGVARGGTGQTTFTSSQLLYGNGTNGLTSVATTTLTSNNGLTLSAGAGALVGGSNATIGLATINAGVLGAVTNGSVPTSQATSTLFGTGVGGQTLTWSNGVPTWVATTTFSSGLTYANGNVTNTGLLSLQQLGGGTAQTGAITFATTTTANAGETITLNITNASGAFTFNTTRSGQLQVGGGGTGLSAVGDGQLVFGGIGAATSLTALATSTGGFLTNSFSTGRPVWSATSTLFGTGIGGQTLTWSNGVPSWVATTTFSSGLTYANGNVTNTGLLSLQQLGGGTAQTGAITFATSSVTSNGLTSGLNITNSSGAFTFAPTLSGTLTVGGGGTGQTTFTSSQLLYGNGTNGLTSVATTTLTSNNGLTLSAGAGALVGGSNATIGLATINAGVLGAVTNGSVPTSQATSTLYGTGVGGQILTWNNGVPQWIASTTYANGSGISTAFAAGQLTITNTGLLSLQQLGGGTAQSGAITFATSSAANNGVTIGLNITNASGAFTFTPTRSGVLNVVGGGTGIAAAADGALLFGSGGTALNTLATSTAGKVLQLDFTTGRPSWVATSTLGLLTAAIQNIGPANQLQSGSTITFATTTSATTGLTAGITITGSGNVITYAPTLTGTLNVANGGTGSTTLTGLLKGNGTGGVLTAIAGTDYQAPISATYPIQFSSNVLSLAFGTTTANFWSALQTFNGGVSASSIITTGNITTGAQFLGLGSDDASTPSFSWNTDPTTGIFHAAANNIGFSTAGIERARIDSSGFLGLGSSTPRATLSVEGNALIHGTVTIDGLGSGLVKATNGLLSLAAAGTDFQAPLTFTYPLVNTTNTISLAFGTTTSNTWAGTQTFTNSPVFSTLGAGVVNATAAGKVYNTATSSLAVSAEFNTVTLGALIGGSNSTISLATNGVALTKIAQIAANTILGNNTGAAGNVTAFATSTLGINLSDTTGTLGVARGGTGQSTFTSSQLLYGNGTNGLTSVATTTLTSNNGLTLSAGAGALVGGSNATIGLATINAGVLGAVTNGSVPTSQATSTLYGTGVGGQVLAWNNGVPQWIASTTYANGSGISTSFAAGQLTITNTGLLSLQQLGGGTAQTGAITFATSSTANAGETITLNITNASGAFTFNTTRSGQLQVAGGGTGLSAVGDGQLVFGGIGAATSLTALATSTGGFLTNSFSTGRPVWSATSTLGINLSDTTGTLGVARGGTGQSTFTSSQLLYGNGTNGLTSVATTTLTSNNGLTLSAGAGALVGGSNATIGLATINAGVLGAVTNGSVPTSQATSTLYGTGIGGQTLTWSNGVPSWVATTTFSSGLTYANGNVTNTGLLSLQQLGGGAAQTGAITFATTSSGVVNGQTVGLNITNASGAFTFAPTISGTLTVGGGGTGVTSFTPNALLYSNSAGTALAFAATSTLNIGGTAGNVTGIVAVPNGGTGWAAIASGAIPYGNGSSALSTTTAGTNGQTLALVSGIPTWVATTTFSSGLTYANGNVTNTGLLSLQQLGGGTAQTGAITFATSSAVTYQGLTISHTITNSGAAFTFNTPTLAGQLQVGGGGTGLSAVGDGQLVFGGIGAATSLTALATSTGGFLTNSFTTGRPVWSATSTLGIALSDTTGTLGVARGGTGQSTFTSSQLLYGNGTNGLTSVATTTLTSNNGLTLSAGAGALVGGSNATIGLATINAGVLGAVTNGSVPTSQATSTLYGTGVGGQLLTWNNGVPQWIASTTYANGSGISTAFAAGQLTITNTGLLSLQQLGGGTAQTGAITFATSSATVNGQTHGLNITNASGAFTFAPTLSGTLQVGGGGTGLSAVGDGQLVYGGVSGATALTALATSTGGFLTNSLTTGRPVWSATSTLGIALSDTTGTLGVARGGTGQTTFTSSQLLYGNGTNGLTSVATTTLTSNNGLTLSAGAGALVGGSNATIGLATINAGVLGAVTNGSVPTSQATSTLFGTGVGGQTLTWSNGVPSWVATTTFSSGLTYANGNVTNTGLLSLQQLGGGTAQTGAITFATTSTATTGLTLGLNITNASGAFTFAPTLSGTLNVANGGTGSTTLTGLLKGNGTGGLLTAVAGTDYQAPLAFSYPLVNTTNTISLAFGTTTNNTWSGLNIFNGNVTFGSGLINYSANSTSTIPNNSPYAWTIATSTTGKPLFRIDTTTGAEQVTIGTSGTDVTIGDVGSPANLIFEENSTIRGQTGGRTLTFGGTGDKINFAVNVGIGSSTPYANLGIVATAGQTGPLFQVASSSSSNVFLSVAGTGFGTTTVTGLSINGSATSTSNVGFNITSGCFAVNGICITAGTPFSNTLAGGGTATTTFYNGGVVFSDGTKLTQASAASSFFWDNTNARLGLGTSTPWGQLSINPNGITGPAFVVGSSTATNFIVTNGGRVGVGTTSPAGLFSVGSVGDALIIANKENTAGGQGGSLTIAGGTNIANSDDGGSVNILGGAATAGGASGAINITAGSGGDTGGGITLTALGGVTTGVAPISITAAGSVSITTGVSATIAKYLTLNSTNNALVGVGTSTPYARFSIQTLSNGTIVPTTLFAIGSSTASATTTLFAISNTGSTTAANGINITAGCFAVNGTCLSSGSAGVSSIAQTSGTAQTGAITFATSSSATTGLTISENITNTAGAFTFAPTLSGTLAIANGGTNATSQVTNGVTYFDGTRITSNANFTFSGATGQLSIPTNGWLATGGNLFAYASSTNQDTIFGLGAGGQNATTSATAGRLVAVGYQTLSSDTTGTDNTAIGAGALASGNNSFNTAVGSGALNKNTQQLNTAVGYNSLTANTSGSDNTALGASSLAAETTGSNNTAVGYLALDHDNGGTGNTGIGMTALHNNTLATNDTAIGYNAGLGGVLYSNTGSTYLGYSTGNNAQTNSDYNTFVGFQAGFLDTKGYGNLLIGSQINTSGTGYITTGGNNIGIGNDTLFASATGNNQLNIGNFLFGTLPATTTASAFTLPTSGALGIGTSSPFAKFAIQSNNGDTATTLFAIGSSTASATTTLFSISNTGAITQLGGASSTLSNGINITAGCYAVNGSCLSAFSNTLAGGGTATTTFYAGGVVYSDGSKLTQATGSGNSIFAWDNTNGSLGIGTSTPWGQLSINSSGITGPSFVIGSSTATNFIVTSGGRVGIGTTTPGAQFALTGGNGLGSGVNAPLAFLVQGGTGASGVSGGNGGDITLITGLGGTATGGGSPGRGGNFTFTAASGGVANSTGFTGGGFTFTAGAGSDGITTNAGGNGGGLTLTAGTGGNSTNGPSVGTGGTITLTGGASQRAGIGQSSLTIAGSGFTTGGITLTTANGQGTGGTLAITTGVGFTGTGGPVTFTGGNGQTGGGGFTFTGGIATSTSNGGGFTFTGGIASSTTANATGGGFTITAGAASSTVASVSGGSISLTAGSGGTGTQTVGSGGNVTLNGGAAGVAGGSVGNVLLASTRGSVAIGTSTPYSKLSIWGNATGNIFEAVTSASSSALTISGTGFGTTTVTGLNINGSATSTSNVGVNITSGCFAVNGVCVTSGTGTNYFSNSGVETTLSTGTHLNVPSNGWFGINSQLLAYASTTNGATIFGLNAGGQNATTSATIASTTAFGYKALTSLTTGTKNIGIGDLAAGANTTGSDNVAIGSGALVTATSSSQELAIGTGALGKLITVGGTVFSTNTDRQTALGYFALGNLTTGIGNVGVGANAASGISTGSFNTAVGYAALPNLTGASSRNTALGWEAGPSTGNTSSSDNISIGVLAGPVGGGSQNVFIGNQVGSGAGANWTVAIGYEAGGDSGQGSGSTQTDASTFLGYESGFNLGGGTPNVPFSTFLGYQSGFNVTSGYGNVLIGGSSSPNLTTGSNNLALGNNTWMPSATGNNQLNIGNLIFGTLPATTTAFKLPTSGAIGIGSSSPYAKLSIQANAGDTATTLFAIGSSTALGTTTLFAVSNTGSTTAANGINITAGCFAVNGSCVGAGSFSNNLGSGGTATTTFYSGGVVYSDGTKLTQATGSGASIFTWDNTNGNLGIGTTTPFWDLSIQGTTGIHVKTTSDIVSAFGVENAEGTTTFQVDTLDSPNALLSIASSTGTNYFLIDANGYVNIGTTSDSVYTAQPGKLTIDMGNSTSENLIDGFGNINDFLEYNVTNLSTGNNAQSGYAATRNDGSLTTGFTFLGINNTGFNNQTAFNIGNAGDGNILSDANDFWIGQGTSGHKTYFTNGGVATSSIVMTFGGTGGNNTVGIGSTSPFALLSVHAVATSTLSTLFAVSSSTASATTTLFSISNTGSTTAANGFNITAGCFAVNGTCVGGSSFSNTLANGGTATTTFYSGGVVYSDGTKLTQASGSGNSIFNWNNTSGSLGLGTSTPWGQLSINSNGISGPAFVIGSSTKTSFIVDNAGNVGVNESSVNSSFNFEVNGSQHITGGGNLQLESGEFVDWGGSGVRIAGSTGPGGLDFFTDSGDRLSIQDSLVEVFNTFSIASSSPYAKLSIQANNGDTATTLFAIGSSTASATTTLFAVSNTGSTTVSNGINITAGCFAKNGTCFSAFSNTLASGGTATTTFYNGGVVFSDGSKLTQAPNSSTNSFVWDNTNARLGVATTTPGSTFAVGGNVIIGATAAAGTNGTLTYGGVTFANTVTGTGSLVGSISPTFTGTANAASLTGSGTLIFPTIAGAAAGTGQLILRGGNAVVTSGNITFGSGTTEQARLTAAGLGVGTTTPQWNVQIASSTRPQLGLSDGSISSNIWTLRSQGNSLFFATSSPTTFATTSLAALVLGANGGIYTSGTTGGDKGQGTINVTTAFAANVQLTSDARLKTNIQTLDTSNGLGLLEQLNPVSFNWIDPGMGTNTNLGFIAQDVQKLAPELVNVGSDENHTLTLNYIGLISPIVKSIQELDARTALIASSTPILPQQLTVSQVTAQTANLNTIGAQSLTVNGNAFATTFIAPATPITFTIASTTGTLPNEVLTDNGGVDLYKAATYAITGVQSLQAQADILSNRLDAVALRVTMLEAIASSTPASGGTLSLASLEDLLGQIGIVIKDGIAHFTSLAFTNLIAAPAADGTSAVATSTIAMGDTQAIVVNNLAHPTSEIFVTITSPLTGSWYISQKGEGSFTINLSSPQTQAVTFDYFIVQTTPGATQVAGAGASNPGQISVGITPPADPNASSTPVVTPANAPTITLTGSAAVDMAQGAFWTDPGATAHDAAGNDLTAQIAVTGSVDTNTPGLYTLNYSVVDAAGASAGVSRIVHVSAPTLTTTPPADTSSDPATVSAAPEPATGG